MLKKIFVASIILGVLAIAAQSFADADPPYQASESGLILGYGAGNISEGKYRTMLVIWHIGFNLKEFSSGAVGGRKNAISFFLEPQINPVTAPSTDVEFGVGIGLKYMHHITDHVSAYLMTSVGPHWITVKTVDQSNGFIFSDMLGVGLSIFLTDSSAIDLGFRIRHLSNAGLHRPNGGIDSCFGTVGYSIFF